MHYKIIICIYGCITIDKYREQIKKIKETYELTCTEDIKFLYFLGGRHHDYHEENFIYLENVNDEYLSASYKQHLGLKYIKENYNTDFVLCCGTDTFINIPKLSLFIERFDKYKCLYIGGHGCNRTIDKRSYYFHSGGPGFILTTECLNQLYPYLDTLTDKWIDICNVNNVDYLKFACDVAISYFLQTYVSNVEIVKIDDLSFIHCNYIGIPCHNNQIIMNNIISCHSMSLFDFDEFNRILKLNNYFV